jgi:hypothetical protein
MRWGKERRWGKMISLSHCRSPAQKGAGQQLCLRRTDAAGPVVWGGPRTPPLAGEVGRRVLSLASEVGLSAHHRRSGRPPPPLETAPQRYWDRGVPHATFRSLSPVGEARLSAHYWSSGRLPPPLEVACHRWGVGRRAVEKGGAGAEEADNWDFSEIWGGFYKIAATHLIWPIDRCDPVAAARDVALWGVLFWLGFRFIEIMTKIKLKMYIRFMQDVQKIRK